MPSTAQEPGLISLPLRLYSVLHLKAMGAEVHITRSDVGKGHPEYYQDVAARLAKDIPDSFFADQFNMRNSVQGPVSKRLTRTSGVLPISSSTAGRGRLGMVSPGTGWRRWDSKVQSMPWTIGLDRTARNRAVGCLSVFGALPVRVGLVFLARLIKPLALHGP
jgi:hypothetical protein